MTTLADVIRLAPSATSVEVSDSFTDPPWRKTCTLVGPVPDDQVEAVRAALLMQAGMEWVVEVRP
jgi:hypothetical protein